MKNRLSSVFILLLLIYSPLLSWLDVYLEQIFYSIGNDPVEHFVAHPITDLLFNYGTLPANITAGLAACIYLLSFVVKSLKKWRSGALILILTLAFGCGFIINGVLKEYWGRPRPKQVEAFGGTQPFRPFYSANFFHQSIPSKSFPCGHASMGFYFFAFAFIGKRIDKKWLKNGAIVFALLFGGAIGMARMMQGGHFLTDVLFSGLIMWAVAYSMSWLVYSGEKSYESLNAKPAASL